MSLAASPRFPGLAGSVTFVTRPARAEHGAADMPTSALARELAKSGTRVVVLTAERGIDRALVERRDGCWSVSFPAWAVRWGTFSPRLSWAALQSRRADRVTHVHGCDLNAALALLGRRAPAVWTPHPYGTTGGPRPSRWSTRLRRLVTMTLVSRCAAIVCGSEAERHDFVGDFPAAANRVVVIPRGVETEAIRRAQPLPGQAPTVVCLDHGDSALRVVDVIRAFRDVPAPTQLVVVGGDRHRDELTALSETLGISDRVMITGRLGAEEMYRWFRTAAVFVAMSPSETAGMAPVEAAYAGARIILGDHRSHRRLADQFLRRCATILTDGTPAAIAAEIRRQLNASRSDPCGALDWGDVASRTADVYRTLGVAPAMPVLTTRDPLGADPFAQRELRI
ncbi:glycosyltransferase family 4 protein [Mycobacterium yunnanensis]|uniref:Glycosyltransferase family 4 protein n=1 Tax=Mycobacterium yunnanensis TaxID=368477 RepID=A0A9X2Z0J8_9MYCO|nr:glycosyltransferase family 4 protein [Mycobacterium yunnanensis]MCV7420826.1 glycosyltransferase family 4 protein [Mycobacterium yunnanensis]